MAIAFVYIQDPNRMHKQSILYLNIGYKINYTLAYLLNALNYEQSGRVRW